MRFFGSSLSIRALVPVYSAASMLHCKQPDTFFFSPRKKNRNASHVILIQVARCAKLSCILLSHSPSSLKIFLFIPQLLIKYHEMTHLPCRDVNPPMPCFLKNKKPRKCFTVSGSSLAVGYVYSKYPYSLCAAYVFRE